MDTAMTWVDFPVMDWGLILTQITSYCWNPTRGREITIEIVRNLWGILFTSAFVLC